MAHKVGGVLIDVQTNVARIQKDFGEINKTIKKFAYDAKKMLRTVGLSLGAAFAVRQIKRFITEGAKTIDTLQDMAQSAGMSSREFQGLTQAASYAGVEATGVSRAVKRLNTNILDANYGLGEAKRIFNDLGIAYRTTTGEMRDTGDVWREMSDKFSQMADGSRKAGLANKALGRSGAEMIPIMNRGADGIEKVTKKLEAWGALVTDETMAIMDSVNRNIKDMGAGLRGIKLQILAGMAEELNQLTTAWTKNQKHLNNFIKFGDLLGKAMVKLATGAAGVAAVTHIVGATIGWFAMLTTEAAEGVDVVALLGEKIEDIIYTWGKFMVDINKPIKLDLDFGKKGQGLQGINVLLTDQRKLVAQALKEHRGALGVLGAEHNEYLRIYVALSKVIELTDEQLEIEKAIGQKLKTIRGEYNRLATQDIWGNMKYGFKDYADSVMDRNKQIQEAVVNGMKTMEDAIVDGLRKGKLEWSQFTEAVLADIMRIMVRQQITAPFANWLGGMTGAEPMPSKVPIGSRGNVIPPPLPTTPTPQMAGRRARVAATTVNLSNDVQNIVKENTFLMNRDVNDFVKKSEIQFRRLGRTLRRSLNADEMGKGGVLGLPIGYSVPSGGPGVIPNVIPIEGTGAPGGDISGTAEGAGTDIKPEDITLETVVPDIDRIYNDLDKFYENMGINAVIQDWKQFLNDTILSPMHDVVRIIEDPSWDTLEDIVKEQFDKDRIINTATGWSKNILEWTVDSMFGEDTFQNIVNKVSDNIKGLTWDDAINTTIFQRDAYRLVYDLASKVFKSVKDSISDLSTDSFLSPEGDWSWTNIFDPVPNPGGIIGGEVGDAIDTINDILNPFNWRRRGGETGGGEGGLTINVPVNIDNAAMASELRGEIEKTVIEVLRRYA